MNRSFLTVIGITFLFLGVGIQPACAITDTGQNIKAGKNKRGDTWRNGLIVCNVWTEINPGYPFIPWFITIPLTGTIITCEDLDTGKIRIGIAKFGLKIFKFLPKGHDYKIKTGILLGAEIYIDNFDGFEIVGVII
jgi:hypothetical protein